MIKTQIKLKPLLILSDGSSFKNVFTFKQIQFKSKDFKQIQLKKKKKCYLLIIQSLMNYSTENNYSLNKVHEKKK